MSEVRRKSKIQVIAERNKGLAIVTGKRAGATLYVVWGPDTGVWCYHESGSGPKLKRSTERSVAYRVYAGSGYRFADKMTRNLLAYVASTAKTPKAVATTVLRQVYGNVPKWAKSFLCSKVPFARRIAAARFLSYTGEAGIPLLKQGMEAWLTIAQILFLAGKGELLADVSGGAEGLLKRAFPRRSTAASRAFVVKEIMEGSPPRTDSAGKPLLFRTCHGDTAAKCALLVLVGTKGLTEDADKMHVIWDIASLCLPSVTANAHEPWRNTKFAKNLATLLLHFDGGKDRLCDEKATDVLSRLRLSAEHDSCETLARLMKTPEANDYIKNLPHAILTVRAERLTAKHKPLPGPLFGWVEKFLAQNPECALTRLFPSSGSFKQLVGTMPGTSRQVQSLRNANGAWRYRLDMGLGSGEVILELRPFKWRKGGYAYHLVDVQGVNPMRMSEAERLVKALWGVFEAQGVQVLLPTDLADVVLQLGLTQYWPYIEDTRFNIKLHGNPDAYPLSAY